MKRLKEDILKNNHISTSSPSENLYLPQIAPCLLPLPLQLTLPLDLAMFMSMVLVMLL